MLFHSDARNGLAAPSLNITATTSRVAILVLVHQVDFHQEVLAVDRVLARGVEVELLELVHVAIQRERATRTVVDLDGMPVVHDLGCTRLVGQVDGLVRALH